jgi:hypothetical protein
MLDDDRTKQTGALKPGRIMTRRPHPKPALWEHVFALAFERNIRELGFDPRNSILYGDTHRAATLYARAVADLALAGIKETEGDGVWANLK